VFRYVVCELSACGLTVHFEPLESVTQYGPWLSVLSVDCNAYSECPLVQVETWVICYGARDEHRVDS
jgi:hypothetical protein